MAQGKFGDRFQGCPILTNPVDGVSRNLFRAIATDIQFWIPLAVLIGGFILLDKVR
jgi:hypothetical protein